MLIKQYVSGLLNSNMYILEEEGHSILIDPFVFEKDADIESYLKPDLVLLTHEHYDHISGVNFIKETIAGIRTYASFACAANIKRPNRNLSRHFDAFCAMQTWLPACTHAYVGDYTCEAEETFSGRERMMWRGHTLDLIEAPGHSEGSILIYVDEQFLFAGDSVFRDYPTGTRFVGGSTEKYKNITKKIIDSFPDTTIVYPGHFSCFRITERYIEKG